MVLAFGLTVVSCGEEESDPPAPSRDAKLVAKWYSASTGGTLKYEFKSDGTYEAGGIAQPTSTWSTSGGKLIISSSGVKVTSITYKLEDSDKKLTFSAGEGANGAPAVIPDGGPYYKQ